MRHTNIKGKAQMNSVSNDQKQNVKKKDSRKRRANFLNSH